MFPSSIKQKIRQFHVPIVSKRGGGQGEWFIQTRPLDKRVPGLKNIFWTYALKFKVGAQVSGAAGHSLRTAILGRTGVEPRS